MMKNTRAAAQCVATARGVRRFSHRVLSGAARSGRLFHLCSPRVNTLRLMVRVR